MNLTGFELVALALKIHGKHLENAKGLLVQLCDIWGPNNQTIYMGADRLSVRVGISERTFTDHLKQLVKAEVISVKKRPNRTHLIRLNIDRIRVLATLSEETERSWREVDDEEDGAVEIADPEPGEGNGAAEIADPDRQKLLLVPAETAGDQISIKPEESNQKEIKDMATPKLDFSALNLSDEHIDTIKAIRKAKKAPLTQLAIKGIGKHLDACRVAGATDDDYMVAWAETGWSVMKAEWFLRDWRPTGQGIALVGQSVQQRRLTAAEQRRANNDDMFARALAEHEGQQGASYQGGHTYDA